MARTPALPEATRCRGAIRPTASIQVAGCNAQIADAPRSLGESTYPAVLVSPRNNSSLEVGRNLGPPGGVETLHILSLHSTANPAGQTQHHPNDLLGAPVPG